MDTLINNTKQFFAKEVSPIFANKGKGLKSALESSVEQELNRNLNYQFNLLSFSVSGKTNIADHKITFQCWWGPFNMSCNAMHVNSGKCVELKRESKWSGIKGAIISFVGDAIKMLIKKLIQTQILLTPNFIIWIAAVLEDKGWELKNILKTLHKDGLTLMDLSDLLTKQGWTLNKIAKYIASPTIRSKL
eukprot:140380_1